MADTYVKSAPEFVSWLEDNVREDLACNQFPQKHRRSIRTSNGMGRVNHEVKRRTQVTVLFPNKESALRLVKGILIEIHEEWITGKLFLDMDEFKMNEEYTNEKMNRMAQAG